MDERTKEKLLKAARIRLRLLEGRASGLPPGADWMAALEEGRIAADRLERELLRRELRCEVARLNAVLDELTARHGKALAELERLKAQAEDAAPVLPPAASDLWGIGRGLPTGDAQ